MNISALLFSASQDNKIHILSHALLSGSDSSLHMRSPTFPQVPVHSPTKPFPPHSHAATPHDSPGRPLLIPPQPLSESTAIPIRAPIMHCA